MATLKTQNFDLEITYQGLTLAHFIEYSLGVSMKGKSFFNPDILSKKEHWIYDGKFILTDCEYLDWLGLFFKKLQDLEGNVEYEMTEPLHWGFSAKPGRIRYDSGVVLSIDFPAAEFDLENASHFRLSMVVTVGEIRNFLEELNEERFRFFERHKDKLIYRGNGKYESKDNPYSYWDESAMDK